MVVNAFSAGLTAVMRDRQAVVASTADRRPAATSAAMARAV
jgi:hypothetical protein